MMIGFLNKDLDKWIALLARFNNGQNLSPKIIQNIEDHFEFYWRSNRIKVINCPEGERFMSELPFVVREEIMFFLYSDFINNYRNYLRPPPKEKRTKAQLLLLSLTVSQD